MDMLDIFVGIPLLILIEVVFPLAFIVLLLWFFSCIRTFCHNRSALGRWGRIYKVEHVRAKSIQFSDILYKRFEKSSGWSQSCHDGWIGIKKYTDILYLRHGRRMYAGRPCVLHARLDDCSITAVDIDFDISWATDTPAALRKEFMRFLKKK